LIIVLNVLDQFDKFVFRLINTTLANPFFDWTMPIITNQVYWIVPLIIFWIYLMAFSGKRGKIAGVILLLTLGFTDYTTVEILKPVFGRLRPYLQMSEGIRTLTHTGGHFSFVSAHAANTFSCAVILAYFYPRFKRYYYGIATLVAFSRIYVGVHFPGDVLFGALYGYGIGWAILSLWVIVKMRELKRGRTWPRY